MPKSYMPVTQDAKKMKYIYWLTTPPDYRQPPTERELAKELDVYPKTLWNWRQDNEFREVWQSETNEVVGSEDRRREIMDSLFRVAVDPRSPRHVQAAKLYMELCNTLAPPKGEGAKGTKALGALSDEEIDLLLAKGLQEGVDTVEIE